MRSMLTPMAGSAGYFEKHGESSQQAPLPPRGGGSGAGAIKAEDEPGAMQGTVPLSLSLCVCVSVCVFFVSFFYLCER